MSKQTLRLALITAAILFAAPSVLAESFAEVQVTADSVGKSAILTVKIHKIQQFKHSPSG